MKYFSKIIKGYYTDQIPTTPTPTSSYTINLNNQWQNSFISNPDSTQYDIYESFSNYNVNSGVAIMYITIKGYTEFKFYIRSYAESNYDYVVVSQLDQTITGSGLSENNDTTLVKAHTYGNQKSGTTLSDYTEVVFSDIDGGEHTITVLYRKDHSQHSGDDKGYLLISKSQESILPEPPTEDDNSSETNVYVVDKDEVLWEVDDWTGGSNAIGVALVAGEHKFMIAKSDATNDGNLYWEESRTDLSLIAYMYADGTNTSGYLQKPDGTYQSTPHLSNDYTTWTNGALSDFNGKDNTTVIAAASSHARDMCTVLNTFNASDRYNDWYVPACGQLALIYLNMTEINTALAKIGGTTLEDVGLYWSSTDSFSVYAWYVYFYNGYVSYRSKTSNIRVRFVRDLNKPETIDLRIASNGVYAVAKNGKGLTINEADSSCIGVALITNNQRIMISKSNVTDGIDDIFYWSYNLYKQDVPNLENLTDETAAKADFNGKANTEAIIAAYAVLGKDIDSHDMCKVLETYNEGGYTDWYVPAAGQLYEMYTKKGDINAALTKIGGTAFTSISFWSSSEKDTDDVWTVGFGGFGVCEDSKANYGRIRFVRDLGPKLISFTINRGTLEYYQAEEGMTFMEWCDSEYNTGNYYCENGTVFVDTGVSIDTTTIIKGNTVINDGVTYEAYIGL